MAESGSQQMVEMEDENKWEMTFAETEDILARLADEALLSDKQGKTNPLDVDKL